MYEPQINNAYSYIKDAVLTLSLAKNFVELNGNSRFFIDAAISHAENNYNMLCKKHDNPIQYLDNSFSELQNALIGVPNEGYAGIGSLSMNLRVGLNLYTRFLKEAEGEIADISKIDRLPIDEAREIYQKHFSH